MNILDNGVNLGVVILVKVNWKGKVNLLFVNEEITKLFENPLGLILHVYPAGNVHPLSGFIVN